jgi:hypothetical protein
MCYGVPVAMARNYAERVHGSQWLVRPMFVHCSCMQCDRDHSWPRCNNELSGDRDYAKCNNKNRTIPIPQSKQLPKAAHCKLRGPGVLR